MRTERLDLNYEGWRFERIAKTIPDGGLGFFPATHDEADFIRRSQSIVPNTTGTFRYFLITRAKGNVDSDLGIKVLKNSLIKCWLFASKLPDGGQNPSIVLFTWLKTPSSPLVFRKTSKYTEGIPTLTHSAKGSKPLILSTVDFESPRFSPQAVPGLLDKFLTEAETIFPLPENFSYNHAFQPMAT